VTAVTPAAAQWEQNFKDTGWSYRRNVLKKRFFVIANTAGVDVCDGQHCEARPMRLFR
jgi:hypothetical protein